MITLSCPTGCANRVRQPFGLRGQPVRCPNCTAWYRAPERAEDGSLCVGDLVARPGEAPPGRTRTAGVRPWQAAVLAVLIVGVLAFLVYLEYHR
jgi:hypothetical protein